MLFMKKVLTVLLFCFCLSSVLAITGVVPGSYSIDFESGLERDFAFTFRNDPGMKTEIYIEGELAQYFEIKSETKMADNTVVAVSMKLPNTVEIAGLNKVRVGSREINTAGGVSITMNVRGVINIRVPYPKKYADIEFNVGSANQGEDVLYNLTVFSRGEESIFVIPKLRLESEGDIIDIIDLERRTVDSMGTTVYNGAISTDEYSPGDYELTAIVDYGGELTRTERRILRLGQLDVKIINYTTLFNRNKLNRINVEVESFWNNRIEQIYISGSVVNYPGITFESSTFSLNAWGIKTLAGFFDATDIKENDFQIILNVNYEDKVTSEIIDASFVNETNWVSVWIIVGIIIIVILLLVILLLFKKRNGKNK